jgi:hypothetical protein
MGHTCRRAPRALRAVLASCALAALTACPIGVTEPPATDSGSSQGTYGEFFLVSVFKPTGGTIVSDDGRINCGVAGSACGNAQSQTRYAWNETVVLNAFPAPGFKFDGWAGDCTGKGECRISTATKRADSHVVAVFIPDAEYRGVYFVVSVERPVGGTVRSSDGKIACGTAGGPATRCGNALFPWTGTATLTADADEGWMFAGWGGDCSGNDPTCELDTSAEATDKLVSARFTKAGEGGSLVWDQGAWDRRVWQ